MEATKPRIALLASPGMGHLIPVLELAKRLVSHQSFKVTVFVVATDHASIANSQLLRPPAGSDGDDLLDIVLLPFVDISDMVGSGVSYLQKIEATMLLSVAFFRIEISKMESRPTALVVDIFGTGALGVADEFNMLKFVFLTSNGWFFAFALRTTEVDEKEIEEHVKNRKPLKIPGCKPVTFEDTNEVLLNYPNDPSIYRRFKDEFIKMSLTDGILMNTWDELEPTSLKALRDTRKVPIYPIGPLVRPIEKSVLCSEIMDWLDKQPEESVIYVSFGSGGTLSTQQVIDLAWGLELSQQRFLWVVRAPTEKDAAGAFLTLTNGSDGNPDYLPDGFLARTHDRGLVVPMWAPQVEVLSHPSIGGFLTHCGWNSALESIANGVPMIAWPLYAEQKMNAKMLTEDIGASIRVKAVDSDGMVTRGEIGSMVRKILVDLEGRNIRARIKELKHSAAEALAEGGFIL